MIAALASALAAAAMPTLHWEGHAKVFAGDRTIPIAVRTTVFANGDVQSDSWPEDVGEAKGLHRMTIHAGVGETLVAGKRGPMDAAMLAEEQAQFAIYRQLQEAAALAPSIRTVSANSVSIEGPARTWFRLGGDGPMSAVNWLPVGEGGAMVRQDFRFAGWWRDGGALFPRRMVLTRDGRPYFELEVTRFDAE